MAAAPGLSITLLAFVLIWAADCGSYLWGSRFGRTRLSEVSPGKTVEGALAGVLATVLTGAVGGWLLGWPLGLLLGPGWAAWWRCLPWWVISPNR